MRSLREIERTDLLFKQDGTLRRDSSLYAGEELMATLRWTSWAGTLAEAACADGSWTFKRSGFLRPRVSVREAGGEGEVAVFAPNWHGAGALDYGAGGRFSFVHTSFWRSEWGWKSANGDLVVQVKPRMALLHTVAEVELGTGARRLAETPLLVLLAWYLMQMMASDTAAVTAAAG